MSAASKAPRLELGGEPRVQLLPPTVKAREKVRSAQRMLVVIGIVAIGVAGGMFGLGSLRAAGAQADLTAAQAQTQGILVEQSKYKAGTDMSTVVGLIEQGQTASTSLEILWGPLIDRIRGSLPAGASLSSVNITAQAPWDPTLAPEGPLRTPRLAVVTFVISSHDIPDTTGVVAGLQTIPGYADSVVQSVSSQTGYIETTMALTLDSGALSHRFPATPSTSASQAPTSTASGAEGQVPSAEGSTK